MKTRFASVALVVALLTSAAAQAQQVTFGKRNEVGQKATFKTDVGTQMKINAAGQNIDQTMKVVRSATVTIEAVDNTGKPTQATYVFDNNNTGEMVMAGQRQEMASGLAGKTVTVKRDGVNGLSYSVQLDDQSKNELKEMFEPESGMLPSKPIGVGETWEVAGDDLKKLMPQGQGGNLDAKGTGKLLAVETTNGRQVAKVEFTMSMRGNEGGMNMTLTLSGTGLVDVATSQPVDLTLAGPMKMNGNTPEGAIAIDGTMSFTAKNSISAGGGGGVPALDIGRPKPQPIDPFNLPAKPAAVNFEGTFSDEKMTLTLGPSKLGLTGTIKRGANEFPVTASEQGNKLTGSFKAGDSLFDFTATMQGDTMTFQTGNTTYNLKRQAAKPVNPLE